MKLKGLFTIMAAALMLSMSFTSCEELDGLFDDENESTDNQAFFPNTYRQRTVAAWYSLTEKEENGTRIEAVFLFDDNSFVTTKSRTYTDGRSQERKILAEGDYTLTGDYENGTAEVKINGAPEPMTVEIKDGKMLAMGETFTKQNNKKVPKPSEPTGDGDDGHGGNGDGDQGDGAAAFFPTGFEGKNVAAWYAYSEDMSEQMFEMKVISALFFFEDGVFIGTSNFLTSGPTGEYSERTIYVTGQYRFVEGDFFTGQISVTDGNKNTSVLEVKDGQLSVDEGEGQSTVYQKQDNNKIPRPSDPTDNGNQGGDEDVVEYVGDVQPYLPAEYGDKTIAAWYLSKDSTVDKITLEAVFLFEDGWLVVTKSKFRNVDDGREPEYDINATGQYTLTGTFEDGEADVVLADGNTMTVEITDGQLGAMGTIFDLQDNADAPSPLKI